MQKPKTIAALMLALALTFSLAAFAGTAFAAEEGTGEVYSGDFSGLDDADTTLDDNVDGEVVDSENDIAIEGLVNGGSLLNGLVVTFEGEVIGNDINADDGYKWVTLYDDDSTIAVYMSEKDAALITHRGSYSSQGDTLRVTGTFYLDCPSHQGDVDVHASSVEVVSSGYDVAHEIDHKKLITAAACFAIAAVMAFIYWRLRERLR